jgi:hypothetical protein
LTPGVGERRSADNSALLRFTVAETAPIGPPQRGDLTLAIGLMNVYNRMAISFRAVPQAAKAVA